MFVRANRYQLISVGVSSARLVSVEQSVEAMASPGWPPPRRRPPIQFRWQLVVTAVVIAISQWPSRADGQGVGRFKGGLVSNRITLHAANSPYEFFEDIIIGGHGVLTVEPGTELRFAARCGLQVQGALIAKVSQQSN